MALYACLTSLQLRALLSAADDRDSSTDAIQKATCSLHIAHIGVPRGEQAARAPSPMKKSRLRGASFSSSGQDFATRRGEKNSSLQVLVRPPHCNNNTNNNNNKRPPGFFPPLPDKKRENNPACPDSSQHDQILLKVGSFVAGAQQLVPHTQRCCRQ